MKYIGTNASQRSVIVFTEVPDDFSEEEKQLLQRHTPRGELGFRSPTALPQDAQMHEKAKRALLLTAQQVKEGQVCVSQTQVSQEK